MATLVPELHPRCLLSSLKLKGGSNQLVADVDRVRAAAFILVVSGGSGLGLVVRGRGRGRGRGCPACPTSGTALLGLNNLKEVEKLLREP